VTVLCLMPAEAALVERALRRYRTHNGAGERQLREQVLEMLASANYSERELGELATIGEER